MKKDIETYVVSSPVCASVKELPESSLGLLQTMTIPSVTWKEISMHFIVGIQYMIWVVTDLFSKQVHFVACPKISSTQSLAKLFMQHMYWQHVLQSA